MPLPQGRLQDLAAGVARDLVGHLEALRRLEAGENAVAVRHEGIEVDDVAGRGDDDGVDGLAPPFVGHGDHGHVGHARVGQQHRLDFA